jgi:transcription initiation factor IIF auxiliary subunit
MTVIKRPPFKVEEEGWGEFDLGVTLHYLDKEGSKELTHDLNFQESRYESPHKLASRFRRWANGRYSRIRHRVFCVSSQRQDRSLAMMTGNVNLKQTIWQRGKRRVPDGRGNLLIWND